MTFCCVLKHVHSLGLSDRCTFVLDFHVLQVPGESYRLGKTRVFFRAGQISTLQRILNETGPEKAPWILSRLKEALANRQKAKAAAEEAQVEYLQMTKLILERSALSRR